MTNVRHVEPPIELVTSVEQLQRTIDTTRKWTAEGGHIRHWMFEAILNSFYIMLEDEQHRNIRVFQITSPTLISLYMRALNERGQSHEHGDAAGSTQTRETPGADA